MAKVQWDKNSNFPIRFEFEDKSYANVRVNDAINLMIQLSDIIKTNATKSDIQSLKNLLKEQVTQENKYKLLRLWYSFNFISIEQFDILLKNI